MDIELRYFSGTGNSYKVIHTCKEIFDQQGSKTTLASITDNAEIHQDTDLIGFCFPVYAFGIPRISRKYLLDLPQFKQPISTFVLITAGDPDEPGLSIEESTSILQRKGLRVIYSDVVHMPANWTVSMNPPTREEAQLIIDTGVEKTSGIAQELLAGVSRHHTFRYPPRYSKVGFYKDYYLFKWLGVTNLDNLIPSGRGMPSFFAYFNRLVMFDSGQSIR